MPYRTNRDLPPSVRGHLPAEAQDIYRAAFNNAWREYAQREPERLEEIAHRVAWAAVKRRFHKANGDWAANTWQQDPAHGRGAHRRT